MSVRTRKGVSHDVSCVVAGYDVVFVESVGVGQSETQLSDLTDIFILCSAPMSGDDLQALKRGISERADLILLNNAEEPLNEAARKSLMELKMSQSLRNRPAQVKLQKFTEAVRFSCTP